MSEKVWSDEAWKDYLYWQLQDKKTLKRINQLVFRQTIRAVEKDHHLNIYLCIAISKALDKTLDELFWPEE